MAQYLTPDELLLYYDRRRVLEYATDDGTAATDISQNALILRAIQSSSGEFDSAMQKGGRYLRQTMEDIVDAARDASATASEAKRAAPIMELIAHLTYGRLVSRRGHSADALRQLCPMYEDAQRRIDELATGVEIFDIDAAIRSGKPSTTRIGLKGASITANNRLFSTTAGVYPGFFGDPYCG